MNRVMLYCLPGRLLANFRVKKVVLIEMQTEGHLLHVELIRKLSTKISLWINFAQSSR